MQKIVLFLLLIIVIIILVAIITPKPQKKGQAEFGGATSSVVLSRLAGSGSGFLKLDSEHIKKLIMIEGKFMNYSG